MSTFPPIADYAFLSDCENNCLVAPDGSIEWLSLPRPDSPSVFGALLDRNAGTFRFGPSNAMVPDHRRYVPGTMVLETTWHTPTGWLVVNDMFVVRPVSDQGRRAGYQRVPRVGAGVGTILRTATCISGKVDVDGELPADVRLRVRASLLELRHRQLPLVGGAPARRGRIPATALQLPARPDRGPRLRPGHPQRGRVGLHSLTWAGPAPATQQEADDDLASTISFWRDWLSTGTFPDHPWRPYLERSALTLKGLSYAPTGAIMAASTTSLPETPGGARNWDYRYTWIRDTGFTLRALYRLGYDWEAMEYFAFILDAVRGKDIKKPFAELQIMYGIGGERDLTEKTIDHLSGWRDSKPVRVGNGAWNQHQNDVWGMLVDAVDSHTHRGAEQIIEPVWEGLAGFVDDAIKHAGDVDQGIWEIRGQPQHFTQSAVMCWLAADRGADLAQERGDSERATRWQKAADAMKAEILDKGVNERGRFRQAYENDELDASLLLLPIMGFLPPDDDRIRATVLAIADELTEDGLVLRYKVDTTDTGFSGKEGTFTICSWWLVSALAMIGETGRARALCKKLLSYAGPLNLYAEEIDASTGEHLGNFPQAFTHLALIEAVSQLIENEG